MPALTPSDFLNLIDQSLHDPSAHDALTKAAMVQSSLVIHLSGMLHHAQHEGFIHALATSRQALAALHPIVGGHGVQSTHITQHTLSAHFTSPMDALRAALDCLSALSIRAQDDRLHALVPGMGLAHGPGHPLSDGSFLGLQPTKALILGKKVAKNGQILATRAFRDALQQTPVGIGIHDGNSDMESRAGFRFVEIRDYRD